MDASERSRSDGTRGADGRDGVGPLDLRVLLELVVERNLS